MTFGVKYVGDLSKADAWVLAHYGWKASKILEFGAGASTQIFAQCNPKRMISIETAPVWAARTEQNLEKLGVKSRVEFRDICNMPKGKFDLIFVDGIWEKRLDFAMKTWSLLNKDGVMIFHDTRRWFDVGNVLRIATTFNSEIETIELNKVDGDGMPSNCTVIHKREKILYENWNEVEEKEPWMWGDGEPKAVEYWPRV